jgi:hypothetical protein
MPQDPGDHMFVLRVSELPPLNPWLENLVQDCGFNTVKVDSCGPDLSILLSFHDAEVLERIYDSFT